MGEVEVETPGWAQKKKSGHLDETSFMSGLLWGFFEGWPEPRAKENFYKKTRIA